jgi:hypothetical protein
MRRKIAEILADLQAMRTTYYEDPRDADVIGEAADVIAEFSTPSHAYAKAVAEHYNESEMVSEALYLLRVVKGLAFRSGPMWANETHLSLLKNARALLTGAIEKLETGK